MILDSLNSLNEEAHLASGLRRYVQYTRKHLRTVVWCGRKDDKPPEFSSAAYPQVPQHIFLTPMVFIHLPPNICFTKVSKYAPQENLIHEALHHELEERLSLNLEISRFIIERNQKPEVSIPWRRATWSLEHGLHAFFVYFHLEKIRSAYLNMGYLSTEETAAILASQAEITKILRTLRDQITKLLDPVAPSWFERLID